MNIGKLVQRTFLALCMGLLLAPAAMAQTTDSTVTQQVNSDGTFSASVADADLGAATYSNEDEGTTGTLLLTVEDPRGTSAGWNVTIESSDFVYEGDSPLQIGVDIPSSGFTFGPDHTVEHIAGQPIDPVGGPVAGSNIDGMSLDQPRRVISANSGFGSGEYSHTLPVNLVIPAMSQAGTYVATLTVTIASGPEGIFAPED